MLAVISAVLIAGATLAAAQTGTFPAGVVGTGTMGATNPSAAVAPTTPDQTSMSRLLSLNSIDDFCIFAPPSPAAIADSETLEVAWCTQPRNNARLIPDGVLTGVSFIKTEFYVQIFGYGDFTKLNIPDKDEGGELDPHGASGAGNPVGGNVTTNVTGSYLNVAEWMQYISYNQFCIRACTNANSTYEAQYMCWHELDEMGCEFTMPGNYDFDGKFETCEADVAYPPGWYPTATVNGTPQFSTFAQYFTGVYESAGTPVPYTVGTTATPTAPYFVPSSSNCVTQATVSNGLLAATGSVTETKSSLGSITSSSVGGTGSASQTAAGTQTTSSAGGKSPSSSSASTGTGTAKATATGTSLNTSATKVADSTSSSAGKTTQSGANAARRALSGVFPGMGALLGVTFATTFAAVAGTVLVL